MKKVLILISAAVIMMAGCTKDGGDSTPMNANFTYSPESPTSGQQVEMTATVTGGKSPYSYSWKISSLADLSGQKATYTFSTYGSYQVTLTVTDASGAKVTKKKMVDVIPAEKPETGAIEVLWGAKIEGYSTISSPALDNSGNVYAVTRANKMYKFNSSGVQQSVRDIPNAVSGAVTWGTPAIDTDGTIYLCSGTYTNGGQASGRFAAYNSSDLSDKWNFTQFWAMSGKTPKPNMFATNPAIGQDNVYMGYAGDNGTIMAVSKADGKLVGRLERAGKGIAGGARSGVVLSKAGYVHYYGGKYGIGAGSASALDAANGGATDWAWHNIAELPNQSYSSLACLDVNGNTCVAGIVTDNEGTMVYAVNSQSGSNVCQYRVEDTYAQEQGGVVATSEGYIVASLKTHRTKETGGIIVVNPATETQVARYSTCEDVSGSPAVDAAGNIHFFTEDGDYYVVNKNCELLVKKNLFTILKNHSTLSNTYSGLTGVKFWSSPAIDSNGKVYIQFTDAGQTWGGVLCLKYAGCTGPGATAWPMMGHDASRTNRQN